MAQHDHHDYSSPFEGPEKLLEIWFAPSAAQLPDAPSTLCEDGRYGLRKVRKDIWEEMLDIVKCKVLSVVEGTEIDAYLLSESSLLVSPHRLILKTCGTTLNLLGLPRILEIARVHAGLPSVYRCFYSRKSFMFPERQLGPHREWKDEVSFLDGIFVNGAAYTVGKVNGDHWLLYVTSPVDENGDTAPNTPEAPVRVLPDGQNATMDMDENSVESDLGISQDYTIEILMSHLGCEARAPFFTAEPEDSSLTPSEQARILSSDIGISEIFPSHLTTLDAYSFSPCGYSANALLKWGHSGEDDDVEHGHGGEGYYTIHVTPEEGWSYASFECNVPLPPYTPSTPQNIPDLKTLIRRVVNIFQPGRLTLTLFISSAYNSNAEEQEGETAVEAAQRTFKAALTAPSLNPVSKLNGCAPTGRMAENRRGSTRPYKRTDKINYEFGGYDLAFASFELRS